MKWLKRLLIVFALLAVLLAALPYFIPLSAYIPFLEKTLSEAIHEPVAIRSLKAAGMPTPHLILQDVSVGKEPYLKIGTIKVVPELHSLFGQVKVINQIELDALAAEEAVLDKLPQWLKGDGSPQRVRVERVQLHNATLKLKDFLVGPLNADVLLQPDGKLDHAQANTADGSVSVKAKPEEHDYLL